MPPDSCRNDPMRLPLLMLLCLALVACDRAPAAIDNANVAPVQARQGPLTAIDLEREVARLAAGHAAGLWPGFDPLAVPLAVYDGERTFLFRHPSPPDEFVPVPELGRGVRARDGRHEAVMANTSVELGGTATATFLLDKPPADRSLTDLAAVAIHEAFHAHQRAHRPGWVANEADLFTYPTASAELLALHRLETAALRKALATANDADATGCWARRALALREERYADMEPAFATYERGTELNEGLATYVEMRAAGRSAQTLPTTDFGPADVRRRAYTSGASIALLLDRVAPDWQATLAAADDRTLDGALAAAIGPGKRCDFDPEVVAAARAKAAADVSALAAKRARRIADFEGRPGWRVVIEAAQDDRLLWPQGFDPLNVEPIDGARVLHTRFVRLGNDSGHLEVMDANALTQGAGAHPLFQGVRRVVLTGLAKPEVGQSGGKVTVQAPGLTVEFAGAAVERDGQTIKVRLGG